MDNRSSQRENPDYAINQMFSMIREMNNNIIPLTARLEDVIESMPTDEHGKPSLKRHWQHHDGLSETGKNFGQFKNGFFNKMGGIVFLSAWTLFIALAAGYVARVSH